MFDKSAYLLKVYISGGTTASARAVENLKNICATACDGRQCTVTIVDINENPKLAEAAKILATPTVVRELPLPHRRLTGDLSDAAQVIAALDLVEE